MHTVVQINTAGIANWDSFHAVFSEVLGFPDFYGRNMNAWVDCMTSLDEPADGMTRVHAPKGGVLVLCLSDATDFAVRCPEIFNALVDSVAFVNHRKMEVGEPPVLAMSFSRRAPNSTQQPTSAPSGARG
jgi:hypothetical protein